MYRTGWSIIRIIQEVGQPERAEEEEKEKRKEEKKDEKLKEAEVASAPFFLQF